VWTVSGATKRAAVVASYRVHSAAAAAAGVVVVVVVDDAAAFWPSVGCMQNAVDAAAAPENLPVTTMSEAAGWAVVWASYRVHSAAAAVAVAVEVVAANSKM